MGLFSKIKDNLNHGGVKVDLQAPASVSMRDAGFPVTVTLTGASEQRTVKSVRAEIIATSRNQSFSQAGNSGMNNSPTTNETVARAENVEQFVLQANETKTIQLNIVMNSGAALADQLPEGSGMAQVAGALQKLQSVSEVMNRNSYSYSLRASADVEGIALDPAKEQSLQILKPGEIGTAFNVHS